MNIDKLLFWWILLAFFSAIILSGSPWIFPENGKYMMDKMYDQISAPGRSHKTFKPY